MNASITSEPIETLLVEDNPGDVELANVALKRSRIAHRVTLARNGLEALAVLHRQPPFGDARRPSLVLLDLNLPRKNGTEVLAEIKADPSLREIRVVVFTSSKAEDDVALAVALGADEYVTKPVELNCYFGALEAIGERHAQSLLGQEQAWQRS